MMIETDIEADHIEAAIKFLHPMPERPVQYQYEPPPGKPVHSAQYDPYPVTIRNGRRADKLSLDVQGFQLLQAPSLVNHFDDEDVIRSIYYGECAELISAATGAGIVIVFDHNIRNAERAGRGEPGLRAPVERAHNDFTERSGPERARRELVARGFDADRLLRRRFSLVNLWRPIGRPVEKWPLALGDARTIRPDDLVASDLVYRDRVGEIYLLRHDPTQHWYHFPHVRPDEAVLIKVYDSAEDGTARFSAHTAFADPTSRPDAPERESIEVRTLVIHPN